LSFNLYSLIVNVANFNVFNFGGIYLIYISAC
jgi:hypothetical protein